MPQTGNTHPSSEQTAFQAEEPSGNAGLPGTPAPDTEHQNSSRPDLPAPPLFENIVGTEGDDLITGKNPPSLIEGLGGDDTLIGNGGDDTLLGGDGRDTLLGGAGDDVLAGGADIDWSEGGDGDDLILDGDGNGTAFGGTGNDTIDGGDPSDFNIASFMDLEGVSLLIDLGAGTATSTKGEVDTLININGVNASAGDDTIYGSDDDEFAVFGGFFHEGIAGVDGNDLIFSGGGRDIVTGGAGNDTIDGGDDRDTIFGDDGDDIMNGGADDSSNDGFLGGEGSDIFVFEGNFGRDSVSDFEQGVDLLDISYFGLTFADLQIDVTAFETEITIGDSTIRLQGIFDLTETDFIF